MAWIYLVIASFGEIFGVMAIHLYIRRRTLRSLLLIVLSFSAGFYFLALAMKEIPLGTAYAVWTGLGAAGAVLGRHHLVSGMGWMEADVMFVLHHHRRDRPSAARLVLPIYIRNPS